MELQGDTDKSTAEQAMLARLSDEDKAGQKMQKDKNWNHIINHRKICSAHFFQVHRTFIKKLTT